MPEVAPPGLLSAQPYLHRGGGKETGPQVDARVPDSPPQQVLVADWTVTDGPAAAAEIERLRDLQAL